MALELNLLRMRFPMFHRKSIRKASLLAATCFASAILAMPASATIVPPERAAKSLAVCADHAAKDSKAPDVKNTVPVLPQPAASEDIAKNHGAGRLAGHTVPDSNSIRRLLRGILL